MKTHFKTFVLFLIAFVLATTVSADEFTVGQKDKKFTTKHLTIKVGDVVHFKNDDPFSHNVYSLSDAKSFDLGSYTKGKLRSVTFDKPGKIEVGCAIHLDMAMEIDVK